MIRPLVPKLCLGTHVGETPFRVRFLDPDAKQSFAEGVPKQSLGTRGNERMIHHSSFIIHHFPPRPLFLQIVIAGISRR